ncbi:MAG: uroporphyrinogen-III synthase [Crocinitomicaceae bacterium]|nr:uroporphyrinogen-III synthase [Crocinitomicaceae bacterium]
MSSQGDHLVSHSFLSFEEIDVEFDPNYDVIFFGSPRAVIFLKSQYSIPPNKAIACTGSKTAELLEQMGYEISFQGKASGNISEVASDFKNWCGDRHVFFPTSDISLNSISSVLPENQKSVVAVYSTQIKGNEIKGCDIYVFTSPSNVKGFMECNTIPNDAEVIAWGESTAKSLKEHKISIDQTLQDSSIEGLISIIG